jgi:acetyl-CoA synthetase
VQPALLDEDGSEIEGAGEGNLCIADSWPGQMRTVYGDHERFVETYFSTIKGYYFTGDGCRATRTATTGSPGRVDDVINVSGHRMGTAEVESALVAARQGRRGRRRRLSRTTSRARASTAYVTLMAGEEPTDELKKELVKLGAQGDRPDRQARLIQWAPGLPKTRSGKIMRRILRKIAENDSAKPGRHLDAGRPGRGRRPDRRRLQLGAVEGELQDPAQAAEKPRVLPLAIGLDPLQTGLSSTIERR